mmetsp:Transcript_2956/g.5305  ORF Transcript_2956/g.5305 Transcript_2956/m.5305 type:complete len:300 (-) Transcript_2956:1702-2601(-)
MSSVAGSSNVGNKAKRGAGIQLQPKRKRRAAPIPPRAQLLQRLRGWRLCALQHSGGVWLAVDAGALQLLNQAGFGSVDGGQKTAAEVAAVLSHVTQPPEVPHKPRPTFERQRSGCVSEQGSVRGGGGEDEGLVAVRLSVEEALYMLWVDGILRLFRHDGRSACGVAELSAQDLWKDATAQRPSFATRYVAFHHFRSKGFLPRSGLQYGADLVVYPKHPTECHSDACVRVIASEGEEEPSCMPDWHDLAATARLCNAVSKGLMLLFVRRRQGGDPSSLSCLSHFEVREVMFCRWQPGSQT